jgi:hypothetical protein
MNHILRRWPNRSGHWSLAGAMRAALVLAAVGAFACIVASRASPPLAPWAAGSTDIERLDAPAEVGAGFTAAARAAALQLVRAGRHAQAYAEFAALADHDDPAAALIALAMVGHGPSLFGSAWSATPGQLRRWSEIAAADAQRQRERIPEHDRGE